MSCDEMEENLGGKMSTCCRCRKTVDDEEKWYGLHQKCFVEWFGLSELTQFSDIIPRSQASAPLENHGKNTSFFHGAFRKYSSRLGTNNYILKRLEILINFPAVALDFLLLNSGCLVHGKWIAATEQLKKRSMKH